MPPLHFSGVEHSNTRHICPLCGLLCYLWASKSPQNKTCLYIFIFLRHGLELHKWPNNLATILLLLKHSFNQRLRQNNSISAFKLIIILCFDNDYESYCIFYLYLCICICIFANLRICITICIVKMMNPFWFSLKPLLGLARLLTKADTDTFMCILIGFKRMFNVLWICISLNNGTLKGPL